MKSTPATYTVKPFPVIRRATVEVLEASHRKHMIHGLIEVDVTEPRRLIREHKARTGEALSFTGFIVHCLALAVDQNKHMQAYRDWRNRLILFDDVDVSTMIEREVEGRHEVIPTVLRAANRKSLPEIHAEIRAAQTRPVEQARVFQIIQWYLALPAFIRQWFFHVLDRSPHLMKQNGGTVMLTSVGMFGEGSGWGLPLPSHTLNVTVGGLAVKPGVVAGRIEVRDYLCLTISFDHDLIDGAPAARFVQRFKTLIEAGRGLPGEQTSASSKETPSGRSANSAALAQARESGGP
ncbi:MAG: 2-oxo acid dehydrogenase subunit E2 [Anaerolineales bacterium]|nr:2-oxo acid dehydrogenase subunit E2 [Anaerolineales bacterium]